MFEPSDFQVDEEQVAKLPVKFRRWAHLPCEEIDEYHLKVGSQSHPGTHHVVLHDGVNPVSCNCEYATNPQWNKTGLQLCKAHVYRAQIVLDRANARKKQAEQAEQASKRRTDSVLTRNAGFNIWGNFS